MDLQWKPRPAHNHIMRTAGFSLAKILGRPSSAVLRWLTIQSNRSALMSWRTDSRLILLPHCRNSWSPMAAHHHHLTAASPSWKLAWLNCRHISNITEPYRTWFSETGARLAAQDDKLLKLQSQLDQQQSDLTAVRSEVHTLAETLHKAMQMSFQSMRQDLANELTNVITSKADWLETMIMSS